MYDKQYRITFVSKCILKGKKSVTGFKYDELPANVIAR